MKLTALKRKTSKRTYKVSQRLNNGMRAWYFVSAHSGKERKLESMIKSNINFELTQFADVLESGYGYPCELTVKKYS